MREPALGVLWLLDSFYFTIIIICAAFPVRNGKNYLYVHVTVCKNLNTKIYEELVKTLVEYIEHCSLLN